MQETWKEEKEEAKEVGTDDVIESGCKVLPNHSVADIFCKSEAKIAKKYRRNFQEFSKYVLKHKPLERKLSKVENLEEILSKLFAKKHSANSLSKIPNIDGFLKLFSKKDIRYVFPTSETVDNWWVL